VGFALVETLLLGCLVAEGSARWREAGAEIRLTWDPPELKYTLTPRRMINRWGYREPITEQERRPGMIRVAALGDSVTYGLLLPTRDAWPHALQARLAPRYRAEVLDFGVPAYDIEQISAMVDVVNDGWHPDLFVYGMFWNDPSPTLVTRMSAFPTWVGTSPRPFTIFGDGPDAFLRRSSAAFRWSEGALAARRFPDKEEGLDWEFWDRYASVLVERCAAVHVPLIVLVIPAHVVSLPPDECDARAGQWDQFCEQSEASVEHARAWFEARGIPVADGLAAYRRPPAEAFFQDPRNPSHPNPAGQARLAAEVEPLVVEAFQRLGLSPRVDPD
jgi:hypothetical protein